jgi:hypothetical protein
MGKPSKQQIAEARKRGIVPGARIKCAAFGEGVVKAYSKWCSEARGLNDHSVWLLFDGKWASVITHAPSKPTQPRIKGRFAPKPKEQPDRNEEILQGILDRLHGLEATLSKVESGVSVIRSGATFMQKLEGDAPSMRELIQSELRSISERLDALRMEQYALAQDTPIDPLMNNGIVEPQPASLRPGDYCSGTPEELKDVADELTAMGFDWHDSDRAKHKYIRFGQAAAIGKMINIPSATNMAHLDAPTFLSRARVTAKELGLKPVEAPAELNVGDWVEVIAPAGASDIIGCDRYRGTIAQVEPWSTCATKEKAFHIRSIDCWFRASSLRKLSEAEIAAHLAAEEAKRKEAERAEKLKALKFGVRVRTAYGEGIYQMEDEHGAHVVVHPDTTGYHGIDQITIL